MSQYTWTYVGGGGKNFNVSLFHGKRTGHVLLMLNGQILQIDFGVRDSKTYSFFIEDEFCEVHLERKGDEMYYFFEINKKVDTPRNRDRKKLNRKYLGQTLAFFLLLLFLATTAALAFKSLNRKHPASTSYSDSTIAMIRLDTLPNSSSIAYFYVVGTSTYSRYFFIDDKSELPDMPLETGDEFMLRFNPAQPEQGMIFFSQPSPSQLERYIDQTLARHRELHPDQHPGKIRCTLELALEQHGLAGLADFYFQETSPKANPLHNRDSYSRIIRDPVFQQALIARCWN